MENIVYNIPVELVPLFERRKIIVRSSHPELIPRALPDERLKDVVAVQLLSIEKEADVLARWGYSIPVELVVHDPATEFALLYRFARLLDKHPIRVSIPAAAGIEKAVRVATSLQFFVKIELGQPDRNVVDELVQILGLYLHQASITQPIEPFEGLLKETLKNTCATLWNIQEEDPAIVRYVLPNGCETIGRAPFVPVATKDLTAFTQRLRAILPSSDRECSTCPWFDICGGYFKWPKPDFACSDMKRLFQEIDAAARQLKRDLDDYEARRLEAPA